MKRRTMLIIEIILLVMLLFLCVLYITHPDLRIVETIITGGIFTILLLGTDILRRYSRIKRSYADIKLNIDKTNSLICNYDNGNHKKLIAIAFYDMNILNKSQFNFTIKDITIEYKLEKTKKTSDSITIITALTDSPHERRKVDSIIIDSPKGGIVMQGWYNIKQVIAKNNILSPGGILRGSCVFILEINNMEQINKISDCKVAITDYNNDKTTHPINLLDYYDKEFSKSYIYHSYS